MNPKPDGARRASEPRRETGQARHLEGIALPAVPQGAAGRPVDRRVAGEVMRSVVRLRKVRFEK